MVPGREGLEEQLSNRDQKGGTNKNMASIAAIVVHGIFPSGQPVKAVNAGSGKAVAEESDQQKK